MKAIDRCAIAMLLASSIPSAALAAKKPCLQGYFWDNDTVSELPITLQFQDPRFNQSWFLETLPVSLTRNSPDERLRDADLAVENIDQGRLNLVFCFDQQLKPGTPMLLTVGLHRINLVARPSTSSTITRAELETIEDVSLASETKRITYTRSPQIIIDRVADPQWLVFADSRIERNSSGDARITVTVYNPGPAEKSSYRINARFGLPRSISCHSPSYGPPLSHEVDVVVRRDSQDIGVVSPDPSFPKDPLQRAAALILEDCSRDSAVTLELGPTGILPVGFTTIRYRLQIEPDAAEWVRISLRARVRPHQQIAVTSLNDFVAWPFASIIVEKAVPSRRDLK